MYARLMYLDSFIVVMCCIIDSTYSSVSPWIIQCAKWSAIVTSSHDIIFPYAFHWNKNVFLNAIYHSINKYSGLFMYVMVKRWCCDLCNLYSIDQGSTAEIKLGHSNCALRAHQLHTKPSTHSLQYTDTFIMFSLLMRLSYYQGTRAWTNQPSTLNKSVSLQEQNIKEAPDLNSILEHRRRYL